MRISDEDALVHPRPHMTRDRWIDLGGAWDVAYDDAGRGLGEDWPERADVYTRFITVPVPPVPSWASGIGALFFHPLAWYRRAFTVAHEGTGKRLPPHCGAMDYRAHVWVNGRLVAAYGGGHTPFSTDITTAPRPDGARAITGRPSAALPGDIVAYMQNTRSVTPFAGTIETATHVG